MTRETLLRQIARRLKAEYGERLRTVFLYGSEARGESEADSDIDVLVVLEGPVDAWAELKRAVHALYPLSLETGRPISPKPVDADAFESFDCPLFRAVRREGVAL